MVAHGSRELLTKLAGNKFALFVVVCGAVLCLLYGLRPISDPDFWWQMKTGEEMVRIGGLLPDNPFNFTGDGILSALEKRVLHGYWAWDLVYYAAYAVAGFVGILALNAFLSLTIFGLLVWLLNRSKLDMVIGGLLIFLSMAAFHPYYQLERPQVYSFLFCLVLIALLDNFRDRRTLSPWLFPLMLLWGNIHGGVVVGFGILVCFLAGIGIQLRHDLRLVGKCAFWALGGILCGLLNPAAIFAVTELAQALLTNPKTYGEGVHEFNGTLRFFGEGFYWVACVWVLMILHAAGLLLARRRWLADYLLFAVLLLASFFYMRNVGFFVVSLLPQTACYLGQADFSRSRWFRSVATGSVLTLLVFLAVNWQQERNSPLDGMIHASYPQSLVTFVREAGISGNAFNDYDWGGYLLWNLYPETRLFIDGRNLDATVYDHWLKIRWISPRPLEGRYEYLSLLDRYGVEYIVQKNFSRFGLTEPLARSLLQRGGWVAVYQDELGYVLVRDLPKYRPVIERHRIEPAAFWGNMLEWYRRRIAATNDPQLYLGRGELELYLGDVEAARNDLRTARKTLGDDPYLEQLLKRASS